MSIFIVYKFCISHGLAAVLLAVVLQWETAAKTQENPLAVWAVHIFVSLQQKEWSNCPLKFL